MKRLKYFAYALLATTILSCDKEEEPLPEPTISLESSQAGFIESSLYKGEPGETIEFTVRASAPAGLKTFNIRLEQRTAGGSRTHFYVEIFKGDPAIIDNEIEYTFTQELKEDQFADTDNIFRVEVIDSMNRSALDGFRLERK